ncbi:MAG: hypothetical protein ABSB32_22220 [Thermodesulfobacteriota bacterium]|jgi:hypothetical protein
MASVYLITPVTTECGDWLRQNVSEDAIYLGHSLAVEHRCVEELVEALIQDGFEPEQDFRITA